MTVAQIAAIIALLLAFGADPKVVNDVQTVLQASAKTDTRIMASTPAEKPAKTTPFFTGNPERICKGGGVQYGADTVEKCKIWLEEQQK